MRSLIVPLLFFLLTGCSKYADRPSVPSSGNAGSPVSPAAKPPDSNWITISIDTSHLVVTGVHFDRGGSWFNFSAWNSLQRVDGYVFWFYGTSGFSYMYSDSLNYSSRPDTLTPWTTKRALDWGEINFDGLTYPISDKVVNGTYQGNFGVGKTNMVIGGKFHALFP